MRIALIVTMEDGTALHPLTDEDTPTALLRLGDRRTVIRQAIERWADSMDVEPIWVLARQHHHASLREDLGERIRVAVSGDAGGVEDLAAVLSQITSQSSAPSVVVLQPAEGMVVEGVQFCDRALAGLESAAARQTGVSFTADDGHGNACTTGIQVWPIEHLGSRLRELEVDRAVPLRDALGRLESVLQPAPLEGVRWIDVTSWEGVRQALEYVEKPWGYERLWALNRHYAGKILFIAAGESLSLQYHEQKDETIRIASGRMRFRFGTSRETLDAITLGPGMSYAIPPGMVHQMEALEDCTVIEVSTPHLMDVVRLDDRYGRE